MFADRALGAALLIRARNAIAAELGLPTQPEPAHPALGTPGATFVTLTTEGQLRGCIGSLEARRSLDADVRANARAAAFNDPRFEPLKEAEWPQLEVEVSQLSATVPLGFIDEADALRQLRPGVDGVIFEYRGYRSTFLPQVWASLPDGGEFLSQLKRKAGLPGDFWAPEVRLYRYEVEKWTEH
ncbi:MAG: AmmeMemoRadiSam system protein A [Rhodocyclaceae bacterium]|jgi:hypothetical protein|nr:AmmeMemoRadiSam system protein A [Rhodocyclaceae bacterium]